MKFPRRFLYGSVLGLAFCVTFADGRARAEAAVTKTGVVEPPSWFTSTDSYLAIGPGGRALSSGSLALHESYAASGTHARAVDRENGHGGFFRFETGDTKWFSPAPLGYSDRRYTMALDIGYTYGTPLVGTWDNGILAFLETGLTGWHNNGYQIDTAAISPQLSDVTGRNGIGVTMGAAIEARLTDTWVAFTHAWRVGLALQRRDIPVVEASNDMLSTTTLQLRFGADI
jgi:hypothetical protein